jgi:cytochrome c peroxidase
VTRTALVLVASVGLVAVRLAAAQRAEPSPRAAITSLPSPTTVHPRKAALGRDLFLDRRLSRSMRLSCASCHDLASNGATGAAIDRGDGHGKMRFNTPTIFNSVYSFRFGWEGRARDPRQMALAALRGNHLLNGAVYAAPRLAADRTIVRRFRAIYGASPRDDLIADALVEYMNTLVTPDAPFDRWLRGDQAAMTAQQERGYKRFQELGCASCHQGASVGANIFQRRGIFHTLGTANPRYLRVPSLRNVSVTAPYFHDGSAATLPKAIRRMARAQLDLTIADRDVNDITAFLNALTGSYHGRRLHQARPVR